MSGKYIMRKMTRGELDLAVKWAAEEGWNPGLHDADCFWSADPNGWFIGLLDDKPIAVMSAVDYGKTFGFLGFYIVKQEHRGKSYGYRLWKYIHDTIPDRNYGLDGVPAQIDNYKKSGYKLAYRNFRYEGKGGGNYSNSKIVNISGVPVEKILEYDKPLFPDDRSRFIKCWVNMPESFAEAYVENDKIKGYGVIRKCGIGYKIGPLFADDSSIADELFRSLKSRIPENENIYLDTPEVNEEAVNLAESYGMKYSFETARMYSKEEPDINMKKIFGVTTFEIG